MSLVMTMPLTQADVDEFCPIQGANVDDTQSEFYYDLFIRREHSLDTEWKPGCTCHNAIAAMTCANFVRRRYGMVVKILKRRK